MLVIATAEMLVIQTMVVVVVLLLVVSHQSRLSGAALNGRLVGSPLVIVGGLRVLLVLFTFLLLSTESIRVQLALH